MKIEHADSPDKITSCVQLGSICDELMEHFSSPPPKHVHIVVHVPPMCEHSRHPFMLPNFLIGAPLFLHCRPLYIYSSMLHAASISPFYVFSSIFTYLAILALIQTIHFLVHVP
jgi:hypothetical protein